MADASIFSQFLRAPKSVQDYQGEAMQREAGMLDLEGKRRQNALQALTMEQSQRKQNVLQQVAAGWTPQTTAKQRIESLRSNPLTWDEADKLETSDLARRKTDSEIDKNAGDTTAKHMGVLKDLTGGVLADPTPQNAALAVQIFERVTGRQMPEERARVASFTDPEQVRRWAAGYSLAADKLLPQLSTQNLGGNMASVSRDPLTGAVTTNSTTPITQSADNRATNDTSRANNSATVGATIRGQNLTDARARETNSLQREAQRSQIVETPNGPIVVDKGSAQSRPVTDRNGQPVPGDTAQKRTSGARRVLELLDQAERLIGGATNSYAGAAADQAARLVGGAPAGAIAIGQLKAIEGALLSEMPRMEGPQSNYDAQNYRQAAANLGDPTVPREMKSAALETIREIQSRYAGAPYTPKANSPAGKDKAKAGRARADAILRGG